MSKIYGNLTELVGNTPLLEVKRIENELQLERGSLLNWNISTPAAA